MSFLALRGVSLRYGAVQALDGVDLDVPRGSRVAVVGASGSGKSTLLRVVAGFDAPDAGEVRLDGQVLAQGPRIVPAHLRAIGLVAQEGALFPHLSVADNIGFGVPRRQAGRTALVAELAEMVGLDEAMLRRHPDALSGGQQQRVALARALACRPRLILLDEPFSGLDTALRAGTRAAVSDLLSRTGMTAVLVTHDQEEAMTFGDQVAVLQQGRVLQAGHPQDVYRRPRSEAVARLLGPAIILPARLSGGVADCVLGQVPTDGAANGAARIMLRQEQIVLDRAGDLAEVERVDFAGTSSIVGLRLHDGTAVTVRAPHDAAPPVGAKVGVGVIGCAHILDGA